MNVEVSCSASDGRRDPLKGDCDASPYFAQVGTPYDGRRDPLKGDCDFDLGARFGRKLVRRKARPAQRGLRPEHGFDVDADELGTEGETRSKGIATHIPNRLCRCSP